MIQPSGRFRTFSKSHGSGWVGSGQEELNLSGWFGSVRVGSGRVGSRFFKYYGSGWVKRFPNLAGRVGSGQEVFKYHGSGRVVTPEIRVTSRVGPR